MATVNGTNLFTAVNSTLSIALTDQAGLAVLARCLGAAPTTAGIFQHGCLILRVDSGDGVGAMYQNTGTSAVPSWTLVPLSGRGGGLSSTLASANIFVGNGSNVATGVPVTGVLSMNNAGVSSLVLTDGSIFVGDGTNTAVGRTILGDLAVSNTGVATIAASVVTKGKLAIGVRASHMVVAAGSFTTTAGSATQTIADATIAGTDIAFIQMYQRGGTPVTVLEAAAIAGGISVLFSADPGNDHIVVWQAIRATT